MPHVRKNMFVLINYVSLIKNYRKKYWQEPNHAIFTYKDRSEENRMGYTKQIIFFFARDEKLSKKSLVDSKLIWKNVKPFLSDKIPAKARFI